jgi:hypothetical protein
MNKVKPMDNIKRGLYIVKDEINQPMYVGSTTKWSIEGLESNHRLWESKGYSETLFRKTLSDIGKGWSFTWAIEPFECTQPKIEVMESALIKALKPRYNVDKDPYESSIKHERYERSI